MTINLCVRQLVHPGTSTRLSSARYAISGVNVIQSAVPFSHVLREFPEITDTALALSTTRHGVECHIPTRGPQFGRRQGVCTHRQKVLRGQRICRHSDSPWSSGLHMVPKKDGTARPYGDYRRLNERTSDNAYPIPHIHDFMAGLAGCRVFSKVDFIKGYHQIPVRAVDIPKTAIAMPFGLFEFVRMPFGLKNATQTFQRFMDSVTSQLSGVFVYLDDVLVASPTEEQHERDLRQLFGALLRFGLVLNVNKCTFGGRELELLSHSVSEQGIKPLPGKVEAVQKFVHLRSVKALQRFLGMVNFYRRFLPGVAAVMRPLTDALAGTPHQLMWNEEMTTAFQRTKDLLARAMLLFHLTSDSELRINTYASSRAIAGAVHQVINGCHQPLGFFSHRTTPAESRYSAYDLELLAGYSTILKFRHVLEGRKFRIFTDQKPLTSAFFKARDPASNRQRHQLALISEFATDVAHIPGLENVVADALSRQYDDEDLPAVVHSVVHALIDVVLPAMVGAQ